MMDQEIIERLLRENPKLHYLPAKLAKRASDHGYKMEPGPLSLAVSPEVIQYMARTVTSAHLTIETGVGQTTVALAALAKHHTAVTYPDLVSLGMIKDYMTQVGIPGEKTTFILESSATALPKLSVPEKLDFAFVDGCHGYPFPALDWHFIDLNLRIGGIIGFDNTEIRSVRDHCRFLEENKAYELIERIENTVYGGAYGASFYVKRKDEEREWIYQPYNRQPVKEKEEGLYGALKTKGRRVIQLLTGRTRKNQGQP